ncbi:ATP-binding protein [Parablautia intestinalis]|uniref:ATP-binding protein n=1 Tax=Parablautia intestinalis TaxID=2320100 RepID=A0A3A9AI52_9FIRM|nr:sensor histidine kinase [Parablautia intestinalis]RKI90724.1 ATP-binding protein [Parablautia intestinalis]
MSHAVCYFFTFMIEAVILWQYSTNLFTARRRPWMQFAMLFIFYFTMFSVSLLEYKWLNMTLYFVMNFIFLFTQYDLKWYSALFHSAVIAAVMGMCELTVYSTMERFSPHFLAESGQFQNMIIFIIFSKMIFFTIVYILIHVLKGQQTQNQQHDNSVLILIFIPVTSVFIMLTLVSISDSFLLSPPLKGMVTLSAFFLLFSNLLVFGINQYNQKKSMEFTQMQLLLQKESNSTEYYEMLRLQNENQRILIHDIKKHLHSIDMLNQQKEHDKINAYLHQLIRSSDLKESARLCEHEMLNSILCRYMQQCTESHIAFHADIRSQTTDFIADNDLTSLFCNLLDNAVKAAEGIPDSFIDISTGKKGQTPFTVLTVINSCRTNPFTTENGSTTISIPRSHKHGFGLKSIRKIVAKYNGNMQIYYNSDTLTFHAIITLKKQGL